MKIPIEEIWQKSISGEVIVGNFTRRIKKELQEDVDVPHMYGETVNLAYSIESFWDYICYASQKLDRKDLARQAALDVALPLLIERSIGKLSGVGAFIDSPEQCAELWLYCEKEFWHGGGEFGPPCYAVEAEEIYHDLQLARYDEGKEKLCRRIKEGVITAAKSELLTPARNYEVLLKTLISDSVYWLKENSYLNLLDIQEVMIYLNGDSPLIGCPDLAEDLQRAIQSAWQRLLEWNSQYSVLELINGFQKADMGAPEWLPGHGNGSDWCSEFMLDILVTAITDMDLEDERAVEDEDEDEEECEEEEDDEEDEDCVDDSGEETEEE